jgi:hypothetical protein
LTLWTTQNTFPCRQKTATRGPVAPRQDGDLEETRPRVLTADSAGWSRLLAAAPADGEIVP